MNITAMIQASHQPQRPLIRIGSKGMT